jgi:hypothetical protein
MNYDHLNKVGDYWRQEIFPHLRHVFTVSGFDDYLKRFAYLPSGKWIKDAESVKVNRGGFVDPVAFVKKYKKQCVTYNAPTRPEDGIQRVIYQFSPTVHAELAIWSWIEHDVLQAYGSVFVCYHTEKEYMDFVDELSPMRRTGNTEDRPNAGGFLRPLTTQPLVPQN